MTERTHRWTLSTCAVLAAAALGTAGCGTSGAAAPGTVVAGAASPTPANSPSTATSSGPVSEAVEASGAPATGATTQDGSPGAGQTGPDGASPSVLLDGTRLVDVQLYTGQWLVPDVEGGLAAVEQPSPDELPSSWVFTPVSATGTQHLVVTEATTDGAPMCLNVADVDLVALERCDPADPAQLVDVAVLDSPDQVTITTAAGVLVSGTDGRLEVAADPGEPNSVFRLVERGLSTRS